MTQVQHLRRPIRQLVRRRLIDLTIASLGVPFAGLAAVQRLVDREAPARPERILVIRLDLLGDVALSLPAIRSLRAAYPTAEIDVLVQPSAAPIARYCPAVDQVLTVDLDRVRPSGRPLNLAGWQAIGAIVSLIRSARYDLVIGLFGVWASLFALASGAPNRIGFRAEGVPGAYTRAVAGRRYRARAHESRYCLRLAREAGGLMPPATPDLVAPAAIQERARVILAANDLQDGPLVVCHAGSSAADAKRWTPEGWAGLITILADAGATVALVGSPGERTLATEIFERAGPSSRRRARNLAGETTLDELLGVIACADLVVSGDSGPLHFAGALRRPVVAIHGPSDPAISGPVDRAAPVVRLDLSCSPCYDATYPATCPLGHHRCLRDLTAVQVARIVLPIVRDRVPA